VPSVFQIRGEIDPEDQLAKRVRGVNSRAVVTGAPPESTIYVVTFSGVTSGGIVTSGTTC
jgi:hypothetical protein